MRNVRIVLSVAMFIPGFAMAQEAAPAAAAPAPVPAAAPAPAAASEAKVTPIGNVKGQMVLMDSTRGDTPDFRVDDLNLGFNLSKGNAEATAKVHYDSLSSAWNIREANARLVLPFGLNLGLGRFDSGDLKDRIDSLRVVYTLNIADKQSVAVTGYYGRTFEGSGNYGSSTNQNQWRAFGLVVNAKFNEIFGNVYYGSEANRLDSVTATVNGNTTTTTVAAPWMKLRLEGGYDLGKLGGKAYYVMENEGKAKAIKQDSKVNVWKTDGNELGEKTETSLFGVEVWGDSNVWGMNGLMVAEDKLTYGFIFENASAKLGSEKATDTKIVLKGGYKTGPLGTWIEFENHSADKKVYNEAKLDKDPAGNYTVNKPTKTKSLLTLNMEYSF